MEVVHSMENKYPTNSMFDPKFFAKELHTYADVEEFCQQVFFTFNGKINPVIPASMLVFFGLDGRSEYATKDGYTYGMTLGNVVAVSPYAILHSVNSMPKASIQNKRWTAKGLALYVVLHELLHLNQDHTAYYKKFESRMQAREAIEWSCHNETYKLIEYMFNANIIPYVFQGDMECNTLTENSFIDPSLNLAPYIPIRDIYGELFFNINSLAFDELTENRIVELMIERKRANIDIYIHTADQTILRGGILIYHFLPVQPANLFYLLYPLIIRSLASPNMAFKTSIGESDVLPDFMLLDIELPNEYKLLHITERIPEMAQPAPFLY